MCRLLCCLLEQNPEPPRNILKAAMMGNVSHNKMKLFKVNENLLNVQKCLWPNCSFLKEKYGSYCIAFHEDEEFIVKLGLCELKFVDKALFLDESVTRFSSIEQIEKIRKSDEGTLHNFLVLNKPVTARTVKVIVIINSILNLKKYKSNEKWLKKIIRDILKLFVISTKNAVFLNKFSIFRNLNINSLIITSVNNTVGDKIYKISSTTEIDIERYCSQLEFEQFQNIEELPKLGGCTQIYKILKETIELSKSFNDHQLKLIKKLLVFGPPGSGKSTLIRNIVKDCSCILLEVTPNSVNSLAFSAVEKKLKDIFCEAKLYAETENCCIILIEDIDVMTAGKSLHSKQFTKLLITLLESIECMPKILVIATTNNLDEVNMQLRRPKRLEDELEISIPSEEERKDIIIKILNQYNLQLNSNLIDQLALWTPGFVGADLKLILFEALMVNYKDSKLPTNTCLTVQCLKEALTKVIPSALRGIPEIYHSKDACFSNIGGLDEVKQILNLSIKQQIEKPEKFLKLGIPLTKGILLYGPPGCAKTSLIKALAKECNATFIATSAADLYSPFVGDSEKKLVQLFTQARIGSPSILFIDEIDAVVGSKSGGRERGIQERILSTLLIEMDGIGLKVSSDKNNALKILFEQECKGKKDSKGNETNSGVILIGATNHPQLLDDALKRPGRFDRLLYVPPPNENERFKILKKLTENMPLDQSINLEKIAKVTNYFSGADLKNLCQETGLFALKSTDMFATFISQFHFEHVLKSYKPSLNENVINFYESYQKYNI